MIKLNKILNLKPKYLIIIAGIIIGLFLLRLMTYSLDTQKYEGFAGPVFKDQKVNRTNNNSNIKNLKNNANTKLDKFKNPLEHFGFKYSRNEQEERFASTGEEDRLQNSLDEADRLDVNSLSINNMKGILHQYNRNITEQLENVKDDNNLVNVVNQGKVFANEFRKLFDVGLFI